MKNKIKVLTPQLKQSVRNISRVEILASVVVGVTVVAVTINTANVIMQNYALERDVRELEQKVAVAEIELETQKAKNSYFATEAYLEIAARKQLSKGLPNEKLIIVPKSVALSEIPSSFTENKTNTSTPEDEKSNFSLWKDFLTGNLQ